MDTKQIYTRDDMIGKRDDLTGYSVLMCKLCGGESLVDGDMIQHGPRCPLVDPGVLGVTVLTMTAARDVICGDCPAKCVVSDWSLETHETLMSKCGRYVVENERIPDVATG